MQRIATIQFLTAGKMYDFNAGNLDITPGDSVIVETERGLGVGTIVSGPVDREETETPENLVTIRRKATREDLATLEQNSRKEKEAYDFCIKRIMERGMQMKLVRVEYLFDCSKAVFFFTADGRVDFRDLVKDLAHTFHTRIEMRQIGVRDESKMVGGIGICGRELCCCTFLREFQPVSVKMAKEQNLALNPNKISGQCGRLLCCLDYEYKTYCGLRKNLPKCGKRVQTDSVNGIVDKLNILTGDITLKQDDGKTIVIKHKDLLAESAAVDTKPQQSETSVDSGRSLQKARERQPERKQTVIVEDLSDETLFDEPLIADAAPEKPPLEEQPRPVKKKHRLRKHGHRRKKGGDSGSGPQPAKPGA